MRCDNCPLCPTADDDVCPETEGKYGIEHADGMLGCKHPRNWAEKMSNEHDTMLGEMGNDMGIEMSFSEDELKLVLEECKHMVGLDYKKPYHRHGKKFYKPDKNYVSFSFRNELLEKMPDYIVEKEVDGRFWYRLTREGLAWLGRQLKITIKED